ncbi:hypothetical protein BLA29_005419 [Euroglyphus maynei]|uniref:Uncharacterized protein n=1 Tax=Euroglyphus maynei TaxID=6958 RepID=A0A1Y3BCL5_EURMA|nr:hypothetical protein BLA29_005419 [Euroglyphus maynei]
MRKVRCPTLVLRGIIRYVIIAYLFPILIISIALAMDFLYRHDSDRSTMLYNKILSFRPDYGRNDYCGISNVRAHFLFVVLPISLSFCFILLTLITAILRIKLSTLGLSRTFKSMNNDNDNDSGGHRHRRLMANNSFHRRFVWYMKIFILLGVLNLLTLIGNVFLNNCQMSSFWSLMFVSSHGQ